LLSQTPSKHKPNPLNNKFEEVFRSEESCVEYIKKLRWGGEYICPHPRCKATEQPYYHKKRNLFQCKSCERQYSVLTGTLFHNSNKSLLRWFNFLWILMSQRIVRRKYAVGITTNQFLELGLSSEIVYSWYNKVRSVMFNSKTDQLKGTVKLDIISVGAFLKPKIILALEDRGDKIGRTQIQLFDDNPDKLKEFFSERLREDVKLIVKSELHKKIKQSWENVELDKINKHSLPSKKITITEVGKLFSDWWWWGCDDKPSCWRNHGPKTKRNNHLDEFAYIFNHRNNSQWQRFEKFMDRACNTK
jgi:hypothetical protein